jgi:hypothetical protein
VANPLLQQLLAFAKDNNYKVTSADGGKHNIGSLHGVGRAIDIANQGVDREKLFQAAQSLGFRVLDETTRPKGQAVWGGPHYHVEVPRNAKVTQLTPKDINVALGQSNPVPLAPSFAAVDIPKNPAEFEKQLQDLAKYSKTNLNQFAQAANTPKANPMGAFLGGLAQGASANIYKAPAINPRDASYQGAGTFAGSLAPIVAGGVVGGLPGAALGGGLVAGGQDYRNQMTAIQAGKATGYNPLATAAQGLVGAALTPIPFANKGGALRNLAINSGVGAIGGVSGGLTDLAINPQSQVTGQDLLQQGLTGAAFGGALGMLGGPKPAVRAIEPVKMPEPLMLTGGTTPRAMPTLRQPLQLTGGVVDPLQGGGVRLRPEANIAPDGGGIPVQGEVLPPELPPAIQQAQQAFEATPATVLPENPLSAVADQTNSSIFMNKSAANQALKATGAPNDHVIVQDQGRYKVVPKGEPIPKTEPMFTRGQKVKVDGKDLTVINEPFGQVAVRLPDGNVRVVPREAITNQLDNLATQVDQLAAFEARRAPVEAPVAEAYTPLTEQGKGKTRQEGIAELSNLMATAGENYNPQVLDVFKGAEIKHFKARNESRAGLWYDVRVPGVKKFRVNADDTLSQAIARSENPAKTQKYLVGKMYDNGYIRSVQDDVARAMDDGNTTLFDANATQDLNAGLEQKGLRGLSKADDAFAAAEVEVNNAYNQALFNVGKAKTLDDVFIATQVFDDLGPSKQELFVTPQQKAALESAVDAAIRKASAASETLPSQTNLRPQVAETPAAPKVMEPEAPRPQMVEGQAATRLPQALSDSGFKSLDEARMVREKLGLKRSDASVIKAGKELGLTPEEALRLKAAYDNSPANVKTLLKEDIDLTTGLGQQRYGNQVPLAHESLTEVVASLTPQQREIAQVLQRAIDLDRPVAESFRRERVKGGATSGTAGDFGSFTPIGFEKVGRDLKAVGYNENGDFAGRIINSLNDKDSGFNSVPRVLESQQPFVGNYANVGKELGQFKVDDILGRVTRADAIKTSDIKAAINSATDLIKNPNTPERVKRLAQQLLDDPTPAGVNNTRRKLIAEAETKTDAELERMITEMGGRC